MPPLVSHMVLARRVGEAIGSDVLSEEAGAYYLGATSPDVRVLTRWARERTHFFDLDEHEHQDSVEALFQAHSHLRRTDALNGATCAWASGFISHLIMDQQYIQSIYRPHFGAQSLLGGSARANLLDRVLQYELDRREREDRAAMAAIRGALFASAVAVDCGFIDRATLEQWRDVSARMTEYAPDWERFSAVASRHLQRAEIESADEFRHFLEEAPELLEEAQRSVGMAGVAAFFETATEEIVSCLRGYLGCR